MGFSGYSLTRKSMGTNWAMLPHGYILVYDLRAQKIEVRCTHASTKWNPNMHFPQVSRGTYQMSLDLLYRLHALLLVFSHGLARTPPPVPTTWVWPGSNQWKSVLEFADDMCASGQKLKEDVRTGLLKIKRNYHTIWQWAKDQAKPVTWVVNIDNFFI